MKTDQMLLLIDSAFVVLVAQSYCHLSHICMAILATFSSHDCLFFYVTKDNISSMRPIIWRANLADPFFILSPSPVSDANRGASETSVLFTLTNHP